MKNETFRFINIFDKAGKETEGPDNLCEIDPLMDYLGNIFNFKEK